MISFPLSISVLSFYGWRALKRIRKREVNSKFTYPAMLAALFLPFLVVDFMLGKLVYLPFDYPGWMYAGMALSLVTILAVDILLVKRVMAWVKGEVAMPGKS